MSHTATVGIKMNIKVTPCLLFFEIKGPDCTWNIYFIFPLLPNYCNEFLYQFIWVLCEYE